MQGNANPVPVVIKFDPAEGRLSCSEWTRLKVGQRIEWRLEGGDESTRFYLQFKEIPLRSDGKATGWPFAKGDGGSPEFLRSPDARGAWAATAEAADPDKPRVYKYTVVVSAGKNVYTIDPSVLIEPM